MPWQNRRYLRERPAGRSVSPVPRAKEGHFVILAETELFGPSNANTISFQQRIGRDRQNFGERVNQ